MDNQPKRKFQPFYERYLKKSLFISALLSLLWLIAFMNIGENQVKTSVANNVNIVQKNYSEPLWHHMASSPTSISRWSLSRRTDSDKSTAGYFSFWREPEFIFS